MTTHRNDVTVLQPFSYIRTAQLSWNVLYPQIDIINIDDVTLNKAVYVGIHISDVILTYHESCTMFFF